MLSKLSFPVSRSSLTYVCLACRAKHPHRPLGPRNLSTEASSETPKSSLPPLAYITAQANASSSPGTNTVGNETPTNSKPKKKRKQKETTTENDEAEPEDPLQLEQPTKDGKSGRIRGRKKGPVAQLKMFCKKQAIPLPKYDITKTKEGQFRAQVTVQDKTIKLNTLFDTMVAAMTAVSPKALVYLESCTGKEVEKAPKQKTKKPAKTLSNVTAGEMETVPVSETVSTKRSVVRKTESKPSEKFLELEGQRQERRARKAKVNEAIDRHLRRIRRERTERLAKTHLLVGTAIPRRPARKYGILKIRRSLVESPVIQKTGAPDLSKPGRRTGLRGKADNTQLTLKEALLAKRTTGSAHSSPGIEDNDEDFDESTESCERNPKQRKSTNIYKPLGFEDKDNIQSVDVTDITARGTLPTPC
jgi:hypothetical protein